MYGQIPSILAGKGQVFGSDFRLFVVEAVKLKVECDVSKINYTQIN